MKYIRVLLSVVLMVYPMYSFAACPNHYSGGGPGPTGSCPNSYWYFDVNTTCPYVSGNIGTGTLSYCGWAALTFGSGTSSADYHMTVPTGHGGSCTNVSIYVDFNDPTSNSSNTLTCTLEITRNQTPIYSHQFFSRNGSQTQLTCNLFSNGSVTIQDGDLIDVVFNASNDGNATIKAGTPLIWDNTN